MQSSNVSLWHVKMRVLLVQQGLNKALLGNEKSAFGKRLRRRLRLPVCFRNSLVKLSLIQRLGASRGVLRGDCSVVLDLMELKSRWRFVEVLP